MSRKGGGIVVGEGMGGGVRVGRRGVKEGFRRMGVGLIIGRGGGLASSLSMFVFY